MAQSKPRGRRDLRAAPIQEVRLELTDPLLESLVAEGKAERIGFEESCKLAWQRGGHRRLVVARVKYRVPGNDDSVSITTTPMPAEAFPRSLAAPSLLAHIITEKYCDGLPLNRIEDRFGRDGVPVDRGTMCRWIEDAGATAGATVITAARDEAMRTAFCLATDATGIAVQPILTHETERQACRRGHYFVQIADRDHVFFEYTPKETSAAVSEMFQGFSGYVQADAKSVYDILFRDPEGEKPPGSGMRREVGCWVHGRRGLWEATIAKNVVAREGLARIGRIFALEEKWRDCDPAERKGLRDKFSRLHVEHFFTWAETEYEKVREQRGQLRSALGYLERVRKFGGREAPRGEAGWRRAPLPLRPSSRQPRHVPAITRRAPGSAAVAAPSSACSG